MDITKLINWFKVSNTHLFAVVIGCSIILFAPDKFIEKLDLFDVKNTYQLLISALFLISASILIARFFNSIIQWVRTRITWKNNLKIMQNNLHTLTPGEKIILRSYISNNTKTQTLLVQDGVVQGLVAKKVICRFANLGTMMGGFDFNIQPWAWDYLQQNTYLLN